MLWRSCGDIQPSRGDLFDRRALFSVGAICSPSQAAPFLRCSCSSVQHQQAYVKDGPLPDGPFLAPHGVTWRHMAPHGVTWRHMHPHLQSACILYGLEPGTTRLGDSGSALYAGGQTAYPNTPAARNAIKPQAKWRNAREFSGFFSQRINRRRKRFIHECERSTTHRRALKPIMCLIASSSSPRGRTWAIKPNSCKIVYTSS